MLSALLTIKQLFHSHCDEICKERALAAPSTDPDVVAIETIAFIIKNDISLSNKAVQKITDKLHVRNVNEVLQTLDVIPIKSGTLPTLNNESMLQLLDECMAKCGSYFQSEIGKFRFLNEMIKLVSPKHSAQETPKEIRDKILDLLLVWTFQYPQEQKIKDAYDMLIKQNVEHEAPKSHRVHKSNDATLALGRNSESGFDKIPKKLLLSTDPKDIQAANLLIEKFVEEDKRRYELKEKRKLELTKSKDIVLLLNDMLNNYKHGETTDDEEAIINELHVSCKSLQISISRCASDMHNNDVLGDLLNDFLSANDELLETLKRYKTVTNENKVFENSPRPISNIKSTSLIDAPNFNSISAIASSGAASTSGVDLDELNEIFLEASSLSNLNSTMSDLLQPIPTSTPVAFNRDICTTPTNYSLDLLNNINDKIQEKKHVSNNSKSPQSPSKIFSDLDSVITGLKTNLANTTTSTTEDTPVVADCPIKTHVGVDSHDDYLWKDKHNVVVSDMINTVITTVELDTNLKQTFAIRPLSELTVDINAIKPGTEPPKTIMDEPQGLKIALHFTSDHPREDVSVIVITTTNQNSKPISDYVFDASISKPCKLRLLTASRNTLPGVKPFRLPTEDITQVMLISNTDSVEFQIICIVSYLLESEVDPIKQSITIKDLPCL